MDILTLAQILSFVFIILLIKAVTVALRGRRPDRFCFSCWTRVTPRINFRTDSGYCPCCGAVMWTAEPRKPKWNARGLKVVGEKSWCPDCKTTVSTWRDVKQAADYCSVCGLVLNADQTPYKTLNSIK